MLLVTAISTFIIGFTLGISFISFDYKDKRNERRLLDAILQTGEIRNKRN